MFTSYLLQCLRVLIEMSTSYSFLEVVINEPQGGRYSCKAQGVSPGLIIETHLLSPDEGRHFCASIVFVVFIPLGHLLAWVSTAPTELNLLLSVFPQGFISGFALIPPWAMQECRPCRAHLRYHHQSITWLF